MSLDFSFPRILSRFPTEANEKWELVVDLYALTDLDSAELVSGEVLRIDRKIAICSANTNIERVFQTNDQVAPVYCLANNGSLGVPTGLIFIVLCDNYCLEECKEKIMVAGFLVNNQSPTGGAWLGHKSDSIHSALNCYRDLVRIEEIESAEPQILMQRAIKPRVSWGRHR